MKILRDKIAELICLALLASTALLLLIGARQLPGPEYDPLGPAGMPSYIAYLIVILVIIRSIILLSTSVENTDTTEPITPEWGRTVVASLIVLAYLLALTIGGLPFSILTLIFLILLGFTMTGYAINKLLLITIIATAVSFGLSYIFTEWLGIVLPT